MVSPVAHHSKSKTYLALVCRVGRDLTCFFSLNTLNRSKSVRFFRRSCCSRFLAQLDSAHFLSISCFSHSFFTGPVPAALGRLGMTQGVRETPLVGTACRGTTEPSFDEGPSTRICESCKPAFWLAVQIHLKHILCQGLLSQQRLQVCRQKVQSGG